MEDGRLDEPAAVAVRFNDGINGQDLDALAALMTDDHTFVDSGGGAIAGKDDCLAAWRGFFAAFPDYRNVFAGITAHGDLVTIVGHSVCSAPELAGPAIWTVTTSGTRVSRWQVHDDTPEVRRRLPGLSHEGRRTG
jgi:ketosteroid isomerase-like protein